MFNCPALTTEQVGESYQASHFCDHRSQQQDHHTNRKKPPSRTADHIEVRALSWISQDQQPEQRGFYGCVALQGLSHHRHRPVQQR